ncbi:hypothetical protein B0T24DRAFT_682850 [Lasiosphaeria ovina]|uniref:RRM domain-containing protein n=1 Tax=Lasiosphaeria ovina TaxID=92902 RepID=A0AAE0JY09_9PEZI|nr:hypothetical protein B0T24DRAFT_682850 [Lasiosphaeria ovina]
MGAKPIDSSSPAPESPQEQHQTATSPSKKRKSTIDEIAVDLTLPEPPSKKARRLLKKGKTLPVKAHSSDEEGDDDDDKAAAGAAEDAKKKKKKKERSPFGVWIGNLRFTVTRGDLRKWLVDNSGGVIKDEDITRVHLPTVKPAAGAPKRDKDTPSENRGFAYVDFATLEANVAAIALSETEWNRRKVLIKDSKSFDGRPKKEEPVEGADEDGKDGAAAPVKKKDMRTKVFVGNLAFTVTEDDLRAHFDKCGKIRWIKVATFEDTGKCKGYGWVNFEEAEAAEWAVKGFVKIRETIETLEDFMDDDEADGNDEVDDSDAEEGESAKKTKKPAAKQAAEPARIKTRKWWVNQLQGRNLKIELAEDDQLRYTKRFKKGGSKNPGTAEGAEGAPAKEGEARAYSKPKKAIAYATDISVARLTGAPVKSEGKKTTFE